MDPQNDRPAESAAPPPDQDDAVEERESAASPPSRESPSNGLMNRFLRGVSSLFSDEDASDDEGQEQKAPEPSPAPEQPEPERVTMTQDEFRRAVQSAKDRELVVERRQAAIASADAGDLQPIRTLAEKGDRWAEHQLAERGDTWFLGEQKQRELTEQAAREADPVPAIATSFDQAVIWPIFSKIPLAEEQRIVGTGIKGMAGRQAAVEAALEVHARESVTRALTDERFASELLKSETFRAALLKHPAVAKQILARRRETLEEPDHVPSVSGAVRRENDFMNDLLRGGVAHLRDQDDDT